MNSINFDTILSTNDFLKSYAKKNNLPDFFFVRANEQTKGKGQRTNVWQSECCKNILISYYVKYKIPAENQFLLNRIVSVSLIEFLQKFNIPDVKIKYPNDILSGFYKIAGILIENTIYKNHIKDSIIGIGLNVNQQKFKNLPFAVSMKMLTGKTYDLVELTEILTKILIENFDKKPEKISLLYEKYLYQTEVNSIKLTNKE